MTKAWNCTITASWIFSLLATISIPVATDSAASIWQSETPVLCPDPTADPLAKWNLEEAPIVSTKGDAILFEYDLSSDLPDDWISFQIFDFDCNTRIVTELPAEPTTEGGDEQDNSFQQAYVNVRAPLLAQLELDATIEDGDRKMVQLQMEVNPYTIANYSSIYTELERLGEEPKIESRGEVAICVRLSLLTGPGGEEVNYLETGARINVRFFVEEEKYLEWSEEWNVGTVPPTRRGLQQPATLVGPPASCKTSWAIQAFVCPEDDPGNPNDTSSVEQESSAVSKLRGSDSGPDPLPQGTLFRLCIQTNPQANTDGNFVSDISSLSFSSSTTGVSQSGIQDGEVATMSTKDCKSSFCVVETLLYRSFYGEDATMVQRVSITGTALIQFEEDQGSASPLTFASDFHLDFDVVLEQTSSAVVTKGSLLLLVNVFGLSILMAVMW
jgi:hypothetical protein